MGDDRDPAGSQIIARPCDHCGKRFSVSLRFRRETPRSIVRMTCPSCRGPNIIDAPGTVVVPVVVTRDRAR